MAQLELTVEEQEILAEALESFISDLRVEIAGTERMALRDVLKNQEQVLRRVLNRVQQGK